MKNRMNKLFVLLISACLVSSMAACGSKSDENESASSDAGLETIVTESAEISESVIEDASAVSESVIEDTPVVSESVVSESDAMEDNAPEKLVEYSWVVDPEIEADDMFLLRQTTADTPIGLYYNNCIQYQNEYTIIKRGATLDLIDQEGNLLTDMNLSDIRNYYIYEFRYLEPVDLSDLLDVPFWSNDPDYWKSTAMVGYIPEEKRYEGLEHGDPGNTGFYYAVGDSVHCTYRDGDLELPELIGVPQSEKVETEYDILRDLYEKISDKFAISSNGKVVTDYIYDACGGAVDGLMAVSKDSKWGYADNNGKIIIPIIFDSSWGYCLPDGTSRDKYAISANDTAYDSCFRDACYAPSDEYINLVKDDVWELRNTKGEVCIAPGTFEQILPVYNGKCWVKKDGKWGVIEIH